MGVIGRLDDQVNEKIIKPVGAKYGTEAEETPPAVPKNNRPPQAAAPEERPGSEDCRQSPPQPELPVWLL